MKTTLSVLATLTMATPAFAHVQSAIHAHNQDYTVWLVVLGLVGYLSVHLIRNRDR